MKRFVLIFILLLLLFTVLSACGSNNSDEKEYIEIEEVVQDSGVFFVEVSRGITYKIVYCEPTKVMYSMSSGVTTLLVNPDGTPMIYEGE